MTYDLRKEAAKGRNKETAGFEEGLVRVIKRFDTGDPSAPRQLAFFQKMLVSEAKYYRQLADFLRNTSQVITSEDDIEGAHDALQQLKTFAAQKPRG